MALSVCLRCWDVSRSTPTLRLSLLITQEHLWYCIPESYQGPWKSEPQEPRLAYLVSFSAFTKGSKRELSYVLGNLSEATSSPHATLSHPTGEHLRICPQGYTCCTSEMEENLANHSRMELETALRDSSRALQATLATQLHGIDGE